MIAGVDFQRATYVRSYGLAEQLEPATKKEIVFCGRSNVGKSSLINSLCSQKSLARVSSTPGKTTTINIFSLGKECNLVDLPGYGYAKRSQQEKRRWASLLDHFFRSERPIELVVLLLDCRHKPSEDDLVMLRFLSETGYRFLNIATKADKLSATRLRERVAELEAETAPFGSMGCIPFSSMRPSDAQTVRTAIQNLLIEQA